jgi:AI-2 transport system permease protein
MKITKLFSIREFTAFSFVVALFLFVGIINPAFLSRQNLLLILNDSVVFAMLAMGIAFVIISGEIDVSVGAVTGLGAAVAATMIRNGASLGAVIAVVFLLGLLCGLMNAFGILCLKIPSIIMTLGSAGIIRGIIYVYTEGRWITALPDSFIQMAGRSFLGVSLFYYLALIVAISGTVLMGKTRSGRYFAATGDNSVCAHFLGLPVCRTKTLSFALCGVFAALGGIMFASRVGIVAPIAGTGYEMRAIAACVLGGVSLSGGVGSLAGASIGALLMASIRPILVFLNFSIDDDLITGMILIVIIVVDALLQQRLVQKSRRQRLLAKTAIAVSSRGVSP